MLIAEWQVGQMFWSILWFTLFFLWIWLAIMVFSDIFRSRDLSGWAKALWSLFIIVLPFLGVFLYLLIRGQKMGEHHMEDAQQADAAMRSYIRSTVTTPPSDLEAVNNLHDRGVIDDTEYEAMKRRVVSV
jgi:hypothetical protein